MSDSIFKASSVLYTHDIPFIKTIDVFTELVHSLLSNTGILIRLNREYENVIISDAGNMFNELCGNKNFPTITDSEFVKICSTFKENIKKNNQLNPLLSELKTDLEVFCYFNNYYVIPNRIQYSTIPEDTKYEIFKSWITTIIVLSIKISYVEKYEGLFYSIQKYTELIETLKNNQKILISFEQIMSRDKVKKGLSVNDPKGISNDTLFIKTFGRILTLLFKSVLSKFCPMLKQCKSINPDFDCQWLNAFDTDYNKQLENLIIIEEMIK